MKWLVVILAALVGGAALGGSQAHATQAAPTTVMYVTKRFYSSYERIGIRFRLSMPSSCTKDEYGFYDDFNCDEAESNNAEWEVRVIQTKPSRKFVYADRSSAFHGSDSMNLYWNIDLGFPSCYGSGKVSRSYRATVRLYHPVTERIAATRYVSFGAVCN